MVLFNRGSARTSRKRRPLGCLLSSFPFFIGALLFGYFLIYPAWHARLGGVQTQGAVTSVTDCPANSGDGGDSLLRPLLAQDSGNGVTATIEFTDLHGQKQGVSESMCGNYTQGQIVTLWYLPSDPRTFTTDQQLSSTYGMAAAMGVFAAPFVLSLLILLFQAVVFLFLIGTAARRSGQPQPAFASSGYQPQPLAPLGYRAPSTYSPYSPTSPALASPQVAAPANRALYYVGQTAEIDSRYAATLSRVTISSGDANSLLMPGYVYLIAEVALLNRSTQPLDAFSAGRFQLWDTQGNEYQPMLLSGTALYLTDLIQPGNQQEERLAFGVPGAIHQFHLTFQRDRSSPKLSTWEITI